MYTVSCWPLIMEARVHSYAIMYEICGGQIGIGAHYFKYFTFPLSVSFHQSCIQISSFIGVLTLYSFSS